MIEQDANKIMDEVLAEVLEKQAFMFTDIVPVEELVEAEELNYQAFMSFTGEFSGKITLVVTGSMSHEIAANILGVEPDEETSEASAKDSLKEILNVICGNFLTAVAGAEPEFDITIPEVANVRKTDWIEYLENSAIHTYMVDDYPALVLLDISNG